MLNGEAKIIKKGAITEGVFKDNKYIHPSPIKLEMLQYSSDNILDFYKKANLEQSESCQTR